MHSRTLALVAAAALTLPVGSQAADFGYSFVDLAFIPEAELDFGDDDIDGDGLQLRGSLTVNQNFFAFVELQDLGFDAGIDSMRWLVGGGGHWPINQMLDVVGRVGVVRLELDSRFFDDDDTGLMVGGRLRAAIAPQIELEGGFDYISAEAAGVGDDVYLVGEGRYHFNTQFSAGLAINVGGDASQLGLYGRYNF